ncbi:testin-like [Haliotis asinina]|uniref:testin-like n=1 Tax=Haliotis asinina TaxID=109174 RepID=UPI0035327167
MAEHHGLMELPGNPHGTNKFPRTPRGPRCLKCIDGCPGLEVHYWRKVCKNCRCPQDDHDVPMDREQDFRPISLLFDTVFSPDAKSDWMDRFEKLNLQDPKVLAQLCSPQNDVVISKLISENLRSQKYISMLPQDKQEFASQLRRKQLQRQLPLHDLDPRFCNSLTEKEMHKYEKFSDKRKKKAAGIAQISEAPSGTAGCLRCHSCKLSMESKMVAVWAGRLPGECWHPQCFNCTTCKELLVDNIYFYKSGEVYCGRHYADLMYPRCDACDELIFAREYTQAENRSWHVHHFCCWYCDSPLAGQRYIAKNNNPYCILCFDRIFSKVCNTCQRPITADSPGMNHGDLHWHACPHCFSCSLCGRSLMNNQFLLREGKLYCSAECRQRHIMYPNASYAKHLASS